MFKIKKIDFIKFFYINVICIKYYISYSNNELIWNLSFYFLKKYHYVNTFIENITLHATHIFHIFRYCDWSEVEWVGTSPCTPNCVLYSVKESMAPPTTTTSTTDKRRRKSTTNKVRAKTFNYSSYQKNICRI